MTRRARAFLPLFALANAGGAIAYVPLLTLLVPLKVEAIAPGGRIGLLSAVTIVGAIVASVANLGWGIASDRAFRRHRSRRAAMLAGVAFTILSYAGIAAATGAVSLIAAIIVFQMALNLLLAPLAATMADAVPDADKGLAGGIVLLAQPAGAIAAAVVATLAIGEGGRLAIVGGLIALCVLPLLMHGIPVVETAPVDPERRTRTGDLLRLSLARLALQIASNTLFAYLLFYFETLPGGRDPALPARIARLTMTAFLFAAPLGLLVGRWSDRMGRRKPLLLASAALAAGALAVMTLRGDATSATAGYIVFVLASTVFLGLQTAFVMQVLPSPATRARDLGIVNLANTLPSLLSATLAWSLVDRYGFTPLFGVLCLLVALGGGLALSVRSRF